MNNEQAANTSEQTHLDDATPKDAPAQNAEMSFLDHLEELRSRIIKGVLGIVVGCMVSGYFIDIIMNEVMLRPAVLYGIKLQNLRPFGQPFLYFKVVFAAGLIMSMPFLLYQLWKFIEPGLYESERKWARSITFFTTFCFLAGVAFSYLVMIPGMLKFSAGFGSATIENIIDVNEYFGFVSTTILGAGLVFELPMITFVLARLGILTAATMRKYRRHSIIFNLVVAAVLTPSPDPFNQLIFAAPLFILYEISILVAQFSLKKLESQA